MGVLVKNEANGLKYVETEVLSFDDLRKTLVYISLAQYFGVYAKCDINYKYDDGKYILTTSQDVSPKDKLLTLNDIVDRLNKYFETIEEEEEKKGKKKSKSVSDEEEEFTTKIQKIGDIAKIIKKVYDAKLMDYDSKARLTRRLYNMSAFDFMIGNGTRKPDDYILRSSSDVSYRLLNPANNSSVLSKAPGFTVYATADEKTGTPFYYKKVNKGKELSYELFITDRARNLKYGYDFAFGEALEKLCRVMKPSEVNGVLRDVFGETGVYKNFFSPNEIQEIADRYSRHRQMINENLSVFR